MLPVGQRPSPFPTSFSPLLTLNETPRVSASLRLSKASPLAATVRDHYPLGGLKSDGRVVKAGVRRGCLSASSCGGLSREVRTPFPLSRLAHSHHGTMTTLSLSLSLIVHVTVVLTRMAESGNSRGAGAKRLVAR